MALRGWDLVVGTVATKHSYLIKMFFFYIKYYLFIHWLEWTSLFSATSWSWLLHDSSETLEASHIFLNCCSCRSPSQTPPLDEAWDHRAWSILLSLLSLAVGLPPDDDRVIDGPETVDVPVCCIDDVHFMGLNEL